MSILVCGKNPGPKKALTHVTEDKQNAKVGFRSPGEMSRLLMSMASHPEWNQRPDVFLKGQPDVVICASHKEVPGVATHTPFNRKWQPQGLRTSDSSGA